MKEEEKKFRDQNDTLPKKSPSVWLSITIEYWHPKSWMARTRKQHVGAL